MPSRGGPMMASRRYQRVQSEEIYRHLKLYPHERSPEQAQAQPTQQQQYLQFAASSVTHSDLDKSKESEECSVLQQHQQQEDEEDDLMNFARTSTFVDDSSFVTWCETSLQLFQLQLVTTQQPSHAKLPTHQSVVLTLWLSPKGEDDTPSTCLAVSHPSQSIQKTALVWRPHGRHPETTLVAAWNASNGHVASFDCPLPSTTTTTQTTSPGTTLELMVGLLVDTDEYVFSLVPLAKACLEFPQHLQRGGGLRQQMELALQAVPETVICQVPRPGLAQKNIVPLGTHSPPPSGPHLSSSLLCAPHADLSQECGPSTKPEPMEPQQQRRRTKLSPRQCQLLKAAFGFDQATVHLQVDWQTKERHVEVSVWERSGMDRTPMAPLPPVSNAKSKSTGATVPTSGESQVLSSTKPCRNKNRRFSSLFRRAVASEPKKGGGLATPKKLFAPNPASKGRSEEKPDDNHVIGSEDNFDYAIEVEAQDIDISLPKVSPEKPSLVLPPPLEPTPIIDKELASTSLEKENVLPNRGFPETESCSGIEVDAHSFLERYQNQWENRAFPQQGDDNGSVESLGKVLEEMELCEQDKGQVKETLEQPLPTARVATLPDPAEIDPLGKPPVETHTRGPSTPALSNKTRPNSYSNRPIRRVGSLVIVNSDKKSRSTTSHRKQRSTPPSPSPVRNSGSKKTVGSLVRVNRSSSISITQAPMPQIPPSPRESATPSSLVPVQREASQKSMNKEPQGVLLSEQQQGRTQEILPPSPVFVQDESHNNTPSPLLIERQSSNAVPSVDGRSRKDNIYDAIEAEINHEKNAAPTSYDPSEELMQRIVAPLDVTLGLSTHENNQEVVRRNSISAKRVPSALPVRDKYSSPNEFRAAQHESNLSAPVKNVICDSTQQLGQENNTMSAQRYSSLSQHSSSKFSRAAASEDSSRHLHSRTRRRSSIDTKEGHGKHGTLKRSGTLGSESVLTFSEQSMDQSVLTDVPRPSDILMREVYVSCGPKIVADVLECTFGVERPCTRRARQHENCECDEDATLYSDTSAFLVADNEFLIK